MDLPFVMVQVRLGGVCAELSLCGGLLWELLLLDSGKLMSIWPIDCGSIGYFYILRLKLAQTIPLRVESWPDLLGLRLAQTRLSQALLLAPLCRAFDYAARCVDLCINI